MWRNENSDTDVRGYSTLVHKRRGTEIQTGVKKRMEKISHLRWFEKKGEQKESNSDIKGSAMLHVASGSKKNTKRMRYKYIRQEKRETRHSDAEMWMTLLLEGYDSEERIEVS